MLETTFSMEYPQLKMEIGRTGNEGNEREIWNSGKNKQENRKHLNLVLSHSLVEEIQNFQTLEIQICPDKFLHFSRC